jgi:hypothetical protein
LFNKYKFIEYSSLLILIFYTSEHLKWDALNGVISNRYLYLTLEKLKCPILTLQWFKTLKQLDMNHS